ncbi:serine carboxypeptidase S28-domain-containing protein [Lasiosphaeria miniovina]|uniref:Serine carboxypeptidase S28-domain-containing protein n=1 Tax=Lasiosphaeria miniovina TaxID=1954250 RepID=A0AA40DHA0_9PEZI|nr:serine carboxypeptidase S28-domain-containing protein [Lasiosphaeria miniovina]KAK0703085.1 serine carboxypeptidase S28-domain-containing protein [Lasiosphaeria miniovina]
MVVIRGALVGAVLWSLSAVSHGLTTSSPWIIKDFREKAAAAERGGIEARDVDPGLLYPVRTLQVPVDHFHNDSRYKPHSDATFALRYWFDASHYKKGGPVIVLQGGETDGAGRLPFLQKGIVAQLAQATGGLGVILEHRYYGESFPVPDLSTANLRFLTTDQALADMAYFARHVVFPGLEHLNLTAPKTPYIAYGGSYAGAFVAFLRKLYPDVYWGAVSSSGVTEAVYDYWEYYEAARLFGPPACVAATQKLTDVIDKLALGKPRDTDDGVVQRLKEAFGLGNVTRTDDFANALSFGIAGLQSTNWDPTQSDPSFGLYCANVSSTAELYPDAPAGLEAEVRDLISTAGGYGGELDTLTAQMLNYIGYVNATMVGGCRSADQDICFTNFNATFYRQDDIKQTWRAWPYQFCTEWGYLQTGSGVPATQLPLISRLIDLNYTSAICRLAFDISTPSDVASINKHGGFGISYPRLAIIDGEKDPWRAATPHALGLPPRPSTASQPFLLIADGVHHWDENGLFPNQTVPGVLPPEPVAQAQATEAVFVKQWMREWTKTRCNDKRTCRG